MGADMLLVGFPLEVEDKEILMRRIENLPRDRCELIDDEVWGGLGEDDMEAHVKEYLKEAVENIIDNEPRDVCGYHINDVWWVFTGGPSWGDAPTESWDYVVALAVSGITKKVGD